MGKLLYFRGETRLDLDPKRMLEGVLEMDAERLASVVVLGFEKETGNVFFASSKTAIGDILLLLEMAKKVLMDAGYFD